MNFFRFSYVALKRYEDAAKMLFKKKDFKSIELALELAKNCDNEELFNAILLRLNQMKEDESNNEKELPVKATLFLSRSNNGIIIE